MAGNRKMILMKHTCVGCEVVFFALTYHSLKKRKYCEKKCYLSHIKKNKLERKGDGKKETNPYYLSRHSSLPAPYQKGKK